MGAGHNRLVLYTDHGQARHAFWGQVNRTTQSLLPQLAPQVARRA